MRSCVGQPRRNTDRLAVRGSKLVMHDLLTTFFALVTGILIYRYHREIWGVVMRFDARSRARMDEEARDKNDALAHFRHTLARAEEQVEAVSEIALSDPRTATPVTCYVFEGEQFATRREAERARDDKVRIKAQAFYMELPAALTHRGREPLDRD